MSAIAVARDGRVAAGCVNGKIVILNADGSISGELSGHPLFVKTIGWSHSGWLAASYAYYASAKGGQLWDQSGNSLWPADSSNSPGPIVTTPQLISHFSWHPSENLLAGGLADVSSSLIRYWAEGVPKQNVTELQYPMGFADLAWNPDGTQQSVIGSRGQLQILSRDGTPVSNLVETNARAGSPVWSPDGSTVTFADENGSIRRFRLNPVAETLNAPDTAPAEQQLIELAPALTTLLLPNKGAATLTPAGRVVSPSPKFEAAVVYLVETNDGRYEMLTPEQFRARVANARIRRGLP